MQEDGVSRLPSTTYMSLDGFHSAMLGIIGKLVDKGYAYVGGDGDVDYAVRKFQPTEAFRKEHR